MKNYLSFGGGVNSVAMMLLLMDEGVEFGPGKDCEAVYVWMPDWPETHEYLLMLEEKGYPVTVIMPAVRHKYHDLTEFCYEKRIIPFRQRRWCTSDFKIATLQKYFQKPCFVMLGIDAGESHRATLSSHCGTENRFPLIERGVDREGCLKIITDHGLPAPPKSGCWICPFQRISEFKRLRREHPDLFCRAVELEENSGKILVKTKNLTQIINEPDAYLFDDMAYPPCQCGL
jgi:hypothetical protein